MAIVLWFFRPLPRARFSWWINERIFFSEVIRYCGKIKAGITGTDTTYDDGVRMKPGQSVLDIDTGQTCACTPVVLGGYSVHVNG